MEMDDESVGEVSSASWTNTDAPGEVRHSWYLHAAIPCTDLDDGSVQELESLDPQKRELLEARFIGRVNVS